MNPGEHHSAPICLCRSHTTHRFATALYGFLQYAHVTNKHPTAVVLDQMQSCFLGFDIANIKGELIYFLPPSHCLNFNTIYLQLIFSKYHTFSFLIFQYR